MEHLRCPVEMRAGANTRESGRELVGNMTRLSHPGDDHVFRLTFQNEARCAGYVFCGAVDGGIECVTLGLKDQAGPLN